MNLLKPSFNGSLFFYIYKASHHSELSTAHSLFFHNMDWRRGHILGHGSSATVSIATSTHSGDFFAVKSTELSRSEMLRREQTLLSSLCSPYIVSYKGFDITREKNKLFYNIFMEYMPFGTLLQAIHRHGGRLQESVVACYTKQILQGLKYLHSNGLVHCDIKGTNILIGEDGAKISDFGCAKRVIQPAAPISGTPMFMAPEVARGEEQEYPCDIWALGCTVIEMATGVSPWPNVADPFSVLHRIAYSGQLPEIPGFLSEEGKDFLGKCLRRNPNERWTATQLLNHPFLEEFNFNSKQIQESNSSSPTSILEHGFWNSVEESESHGNSIHTSFENSAADRIRSLAAFSGEPSWERDDGDWITTRGNEDEVDGASISGSETTSTGDGLKELVKSNVSCRISGYFCEREDYKCRKISDILNFERGVDEMLLPSMSVFL